MKNRLLCVAALSGFLITSGTWAQAPEVPNPPAKTEAKKKAKKPKAQNGEKGSRVKFIPGSQESKKERSARLTRECKGEVNAGACTGYTR